MIGNNILFDDRKVKKKNKELFKTDNIVVDKILVSKKKPYGTTKSNISLDTMMIDDGIIRALCIKLPQMIGYVKCLNNNDDNNNNNNNKTMPFKVIDNKLLKRYTKIWGKISYLFGKEFEPVYSDNDK